MKKDEAVDILQRYKNWNVDQKSVSKAFRGKHTIVDDIFDERRALILKAHKTLNKD